MKRIIEVTYDGECPCACMGRLIIKVDGEVVYNKNHCCFSTGSVWFDKEWNANVKSGELIWNDKEEFDEGIQSEVEDVLSQVSVCCGGCI